MGDVKPVEPVKLICGIISADEDLVRRARGEMEQRYGAVDLECGPFRFDCTGYYGEEMGQNLQRWFVSFGKTIDPGVIADVKLRTNEIETKFAETCGGGRKRKVNLDPGYITADKLVLATTKNYSHRIYVGKGIYAEVTLTFRKDGCAFFEWTYPDFKAGRYTAFLLQVRRSLLDVRKK
jgi:hypothetical protein